MFDALDVALFILNLPSSLDFPTMRYLQPSITDWLSFRPLFGMPRGVEVSHSYEAFAVFQVEWQL